MKRPIMTFRSSDENFRGSADLIVNCMSKATAIYPNPVPTIAEVQASLTQYTQDLSEAATLDRIKVGAKNESRKKLEKLLVQLGIYVMWTADGDEQKMKESGFELSKTPSPSHIVNPGRVILKNGISSGQLISKVNSSRTVKVYSHQITEDPDGEWTSFPSSKSTHLFTGLTPGKQYFIRVLVMGSNGQIAYSPVSSIFAQ